MIPTRTPEECRDLADRQHLGEDLGFSDEFVAEWRTKTPIKKRPSPLPDPPVRVTAEPQPKPKSPVKPARKKKPKP